MRKYKYTKVAGKPIRVTVPITKHIIRGFTAQLNTCTLRLTKTVLL